MLPYIIFRGKYGGVFFFPQGINNLTYEVDLLVIVELSLPEW